MPGRDVINAQQLVIQLLSMGLAPCSPNTFSKCSQDTYSRMMVFSKEIQNVRGVCQIRRLVPGHDTGDSSNTQNSTKCPECHNLLSLETPTEFLNDQWAKDSIIAPIVGLLATQGCRSGTCRPRRVRYIPRTCRAPATTGLYLTHALGRIGHWLDTIKCVESLFGSAK
jgi:hypothetical protein